MTDPGPDVNLFTGGMLGDDAIVRQSLGHLFTGSESDTNIMDRLISVEITASPSDKMMRGTFVFTGKVEPLYDEQFTYAIPDYTGTDQVVFVGMFIDGQTVYGAAIDRTTCVAYDMSFNLTMNYLTDADRTLLSIIHQQNITYYQLDFTNYTGLFHEGDIVVGGTSGHVALIRDVDNVTHRLILTIISGTPDGDGDYFTNGEYLTVNGANVATADGQTVEYTYTDYYPEDWVERVLGGAYWATTTGVYPYRLANSATLWAPTPTTGIQKTFPFEDLQTMIQAIQKVAEYMDYIFYVRWVIVAGTYRPAAYFIPEDDIDSATDGLDLPAKVTLTPASYCVISPAVGERSGTEKVNRIIVRCQALGSSQWFTSVKETADIAAGKIPRTYKEINHDIYTQADCDARCDDLYDYYCTPVLKYNVALRARSDLRLLQQLALSGFADLTSGDYRIISIRYDYRADQSTGAIINHTELVIEPESQFRACLNLKRIFTDSVQQQRAVIRDMQNQEAKIEAGVVTYRSGTDDELLVITEQGLVRPSRDAS